MNESDDNKKFVVDFSDISTAERAARWGVWRVSGIGFARFLALLDAAEGNLAGLFAQPQREQRALVERANIGEQAQLRVLERLRCTDPEDAYARELDLLGADGQLLAIGEPAYPRELLDLRYPPLFLYVRGSLARGSQVALVGSRRVQYAQAALAQQIAGDLARAGVMTVSGGALGVDAAAHLGCLEAGAASIAVLAGGVERPTPRRNAALFERMVEHGALISEYPLGVVPRPYHFQRRNELIAALSQATVVIRAGLQSGTMLTARAAAELGRPICAVPGAPDEPLAAGCNQLLVDGAACVRDARDILKRVFERPEDASQLSLDLRASAAIRRPARARQPSAPKTVELGAFSKDARALFEALRMLAGPAGADVGRDELKRKMGWSESRLCPAMLELELGGAMQKKAGANRYRPA